MEKPEAFEGTEEFEGITSQAKELLETITEEEKIKTLLNRKKQEFEESNAALIGGLESLKRKRERQEEALKARRCALYELTKEKEAISGVGIRVMQEFIYQEDKALNWAMEHKLAVKLDNPAFKKIAKAQEIDFVEIKERITATIGKELGKEVE